jgi:hypothetical protein
MNRPTLITNSRTGWGAIPSNKVKAALIPMATVVKPLEITTAGPSIGGSVKNIKTITRA